MPHTTAPSPRTRVRRLPERAHYDADSIAAIVDAAMLCTVAFQIDGMVHAIPTIHWREGEHLYIHGAKGSRMLKALTEGEACVTIALADGLVLARSALHHSMNYRSVVLYGRFEAVTEPAYKLASLRAFIDGLYPGRWDTLPDQRQGAQRHHRAADRARRGLGQGARLGREGRRGRPGVAGVGGRDPAADDGGRTGHGSRQRGA